MTTFRESAAAGGPAARSAAPATARARSAWRWRPSRAAGLAFLMGLVVTAALVLASLALYNRNERRLLNLRARELNLGLAGTLPAIQTPLAPAARPAQAPGGQPPKVP